MFTQCGFHNNCQFKDKQKIMSVDTEESIYELIPKVVPQRGKGPRYAAQSLGLGMFLLNC